MEQTFYVDGSLHPRILRDNEGKPNVKLIQETYALLFRFLKHTTTDGFGHERPQPPPVFPNLDFPIWDDPAEDCAPGDDPDDSSFWDDLLDLLLSIVKVIIYIVEVAAWLGSLPWAVLADVTTYPLRLGIYYALELPLFHLFKSVRSALVMTGYLAPMDDEIVSGLTRVGFPDAAAFDELKAHMEDVFGGMLAEKVEQSEATFRDPAYPHLNTDNDYRAPWEYPSSPSELPNAVTPPRGPAVRVTASPHQRGADVRTLFDVVMGTPGLRDAFEAAQSPSEADSAGQKVTPKEHLGDAVSFSQYLCWLATRIEDADGNRPSLVDWNLDGDRGYGYHCWDWNRAHEHLVEDPERNSYAAPCQPPSQAAGFDETQPVRLHFCEEPDPGCGRSGKGGGDAPIPLQVPWLRFVLACPR